MGSVMADTRFTVNAFCDSSSQFTHEKLMLSRNRGTAVTCDENISVVNHKVQSATKQVCNGYFHWEVCHVLICFLFWYKSLMSNLHLNPFQKHYECFDCQGCYLFKEQAKQLDTRVLLRALASCYSYTTFGPGNPALPVGSISLTHMENEGSRLIG